MIEESTSILPLSRFVSEHPAEEAPESPDHEICDVVYGEVKQAVSETREQAPAELVAVKNAPCLPPEAMLGIVTFCYTNGVLGAGDIERKLWKNQQLTSTRAADIPTAKTISRFRRLNRFLIQFTLEKALRRVRHALARITFSQTLPYEGAELKPAKPALSAITTTPAPGEGTTILVRKEAKQRVENATLLDSTDSDS